MGCLAAFEGSRRLAIMCGGQLGRMRGTGWWSRLMSVRLTVSGLYSARTLFQGSYVDMIRVPCFLRLLSNFQTMSLFYHPNIRTSPSDYARIARNGFIRCDILLHQTKTIRYLGYCLHCHKIFSLSWSKKHSRAMRNAAVDVSRFFKPDKVEHYRQDILSELELLYENGRFSSSSTSTERTTNSQTTLHVGPEIACFDDRSPVVTIQESPAPDQPPNRIITDSSQNNHDSNLLGIHESIQKC